MTATFDQSITAAKAAAAASDWTAAVPHWCAALSVRPREPMALLGLADALTALGAAAAGAMMSDDIEAQAEARNDIATLGRLAIMAQRGGDVGRAVRLWTGLQERSPDDPLPAARLAATFRDGGDVAKAEAVTSQAVIRFSENAGVLVQHAANAMAAQDWRAARQRWERVIAVFPRHPTAHQQLLAAERNAEASADTEIVSGPAKWPTSPELMVILDDVVSLGSDCEVGLLQRNFGSEPMSLLRFARTPVASLIAALTHRFSGFGDLDQTRIDLRGEQYFSTDTVYSILSHTGIYARGAPPDDMLERVCRRQRKMRELLVNQFGRADRLFVYADADLGDADIDALFRRMRRLGPVTVLFVRRPLLGEPVGEIMEIQDGLFVATLPTIGDIKAGDGGGTRDQWISFLRVAHGRLLTRRPVVAFAKGYQPA